MKLVKGIICKWDDRVNTVLSQGGKENTWCFKSTKEEILGSAAPQDALQAAGPSPVSAAKSKTTMATGRGEPPVAPSALQSPQTNDKNSTPVRRGPDALFEQVPGMCPARISLGLP